MACLSGLVTAHASEHARLDTQHEMHKLRLKGLFVQPEAVRRALDTRENDLRPAVLDIGTGSGAWAIDMAETFPATDVLGFDISPPHLSRCVQSSGLVPSWFNQTSVAPPRRTVVSRSET